MAFWNMARRRGKLISSTVGAALAAVAISATPGGARPCPEGATMIVVAHQDDDITFMNPDETADVRAGRCVRIVFVTAGDAGGSRAYWARRELGAKRAHETMAGVAEAPTIDGSLDIRGHVLAHKTLSSAPAIDMVFMRLPDGGVGGQGFERTGHVSLKKLVENDIEQIATVPDADFDSLALATRYTRIELEKTLLGLMNAFRPDRILIQNNLAADLGDSDADHSDHLNAARLAAAAAKTYARQRSLKLAKLLTGYRGYEVFRYKQNVFGAELDATLASFGAYAAVEGGACANADCSSYQENPTSFRGYPRWIRRQYRLGAPTPAVGATEIHGRGDGGVRDTCLDLDDNVAATGDPVRISACAGVETQKWLYDANAGAIRPMADAGMCVRTRVYPPKNGTKVDIAACDGSPAQSWRLSATGEFLNASGKCLEIPGAGVDGTNVVVHDCSYAEPQLWGYDTPAIPIAPSHMFASGVDGNLCLNSEGGKYALDGAVTVRSCNGSGAQGWRFPAGGQMRAPDGRCVDAKTSPTTSGDPIVTRACDHSDPNAVSAPQRWGYAIPSLIRLGSPANTCFGVRGGATDSGTIVEGRDCAGAIPRQSWVKDPG